MVSIFSGKHECQRRKSGARQACYADPLCEGLGVLLRKGENMEIIEEAVTRDGKIYKDLPFLVGDMTDYWIRESGSMSTNQRQNFASFLAKLSAAGVADDKLCGCALITLRDALESTTRLGKGAPSPTVVSERQDQVEQDDHRNDEALSIAELLPAANAWIFYAGHKIIQLSDNSVNIFPLRSGCWATWHELKVLYQKTVDSARRGGYFG
jgi:hypothetical protein